LALLASLSWLDILQVLGITLNDISRWSSEAGVSRAGKLMAICLATSCCSAPADLSLGKCWLAMVLIFIALPHAAFNHGT